MPTLNPLPAARISPPPRKSPRTKLPLNKVLCGDCVELLREMPSNSVDAALTSPPYFQQRDYAGMGIGNEESVEEYVAALLDGFAEVARVVKPTGNIVYNLGDKYRNGGLLLAPFRFALAACERFPVSLVNNITWVKRNPTPRQYKRRLVSATEPFFHFAKGADYYHDRDAFHEGGGENGRAAPALLRGRPSPKMGEKYRTLLAESALTPEEKRRGLEALENALEEVRRGKIQSFRMKIRGIHAPAFGGQDGGRNNQMRRGGFTVIRILGEPMKRDILRDNTPPDAREDVMESAVESGNGSGHPAVFPTLIVRELIRMLCPPGGVVLDPYAGSGATLVAAKTEKRDFIGVDINPQYCEYAREWTKQIRP